MSALLLGVCVCGEPLFRHRLGRRQITCSELARLDLAVYRNQFRQSGAEPPMQLIRELEIVARGSDGDDTLGVGHA